jgi:cytochrome c553
MTPIRFLTVTYRRLACALLAVSSALLARGAEPWWAYGFVTPAAPGEKATLPGPPVRALRPNENAAELTRKHRIDGSAGAYSVVEIRNGNEVVDWFPDDHPPLTPILKHGPASLGANAYGCAFCHLPNGKGKPENAPLAGLPAAYFARQLHDMRKGERSSADPRKANTLLMIELAKAMTDAEIKETAEYFAAMTWTPWIRVIETERVPRTKTVSGMFVPLEKEATEPLASRIIEVPENPEQTELLRNPRSGFVAYVPVGSVHQGEALVLAGGGTMVDGKQVGGKTLACATCHGPDLNGIADVPGIAGRSPSYLVRQLYDIQQGTRKSPQSQLMLPVVAHLNQDDLVAIGAYLASLRP